MLSPNSRPFKDGDEAQIVKLYNKITGRNRTIQQHRWEWLESPVKKNSIWVIEDQNSSEIIGHHGLIPTTISFNDQTYLMGKTENTIIEPSLSGNGMYFLYEKKFFEAASSQFDMLATTSGHGIPGKIRRRLNYQSVGKYEIYFTLCKNKNIRKGIETVLTSLSWPRPIIVVSKYVAALFPGTLSLLFRVRKDKKHKIVCRQVTDINECREDINNFWQQNKKYFGVTIDRNYDFLRWRIFDNPNIDYHFVEARSDGELQGYIILKVKCGSVKYGVIEDMVAKNLDENIYLGLMLEAKRQFNMEGCAAIVFPTLQSNNKLAAILRKGGFYKNRIIFKLSKLILNRKLPEQAEFLVNVTQKGINEDQILNSANWYFTGLFFEGIN